MSLYSSPRTQKVLALLGAGRPADALKAASEADRSMGVADDRYARGYLEAVALSALGEWERCFAALASLIEDGYPCPLHFSRFRPLEDLPGFSELKSANERNIARLGARPACQVHLPDRAGEGPMPLLLALHGDGLDGTIEDFRGQWGPREVVDRGCIMAYLQSSQILGHGFYGWMRDLEAARRDARDCVRDLLSQYSIDRDRIIVGGFSGGAYAALDLAFSGAVRARGVIAMSPAARPPSVDGDAVAKAARSGMHAFLTEGEQALPAPADGLASLFESQGLAHRYLVHPGGHDVPVDLAGAVDEAFRIILGRT